MKKFKLIKTPTFVHACTIIQDDESGKQHSQKLRVRFNKFPRTEWDALTTKTDDDRLLYDVIVNKIEDEIEGDGGDTLSNEDAIALLREDISITGQIVEQFMEVHLGIAAKNARASRGR